MKAIDTEYKGHLFRSRLEARWAVYFDALGVKWEYEIEGFEMGGVRYLPDFFFPEYGIWGEVKPEGHENKDLQKWLMFTTEKTLVIFNGKPNAAIHDCYACFDGVLKVIPFADKTKESYGCLWYCTQKEDWSENEPYKAAIRTANFKRFEHGLRR